MEILNNITEHPTTTKERVVRQLAEESSELSKACIKYLRAIDVEDATPVTEEQALADIHEEYADVSLVAWVLSDMGVLDDDILAEWCELKARRWDTRLDGIGEKDE